MPSDTEIAVYVDDIKITSGSDILLDEGFENFNETTTTKELVNHGIQTQWGGGESECLYKIATVKATEKPRNTRIRATIPYRYIILFTRGIPLR